jgi:hypothetical protein
MAFCYLKALITRGKKESAVWIRSHVEQNFVDDDEKTAAEIATLNTHKTTH